MQPPLPSLAREGRNAPRGEVPLATRPVQHFQRAETFFIEEESDCESIDDKLTVALLQPWRKVLPPPVPSLARGGKNMPFCEMPINGKIARSFGSHMSTSDSDSESADGDLLRAYRELWWNSAMGFGKNLGDSPRSTATGSDNGERPLNAAMMRELMCRELTPEDYELLLCLDEGVKNGKTLLGSNVAESLPVADVEGAWVGEACSICLSEMSSEDDVRALPLCGHCFHGPCAVHWLSTCKATCPLCGVEVVDETSSTIPPNPSESECSWSASYSAGTPCSSMASTPRECLR
jgi:hypothetical protein